MAFRIIYKIIFEVQILHEYFLNKGEKAFDQFSKEERDKSLGKYEVQDFFDIQPTAECEKQLRNYHLKFRKTKTGFFVVAEVKRLEPELADSKSYTPFIPLDVKFNLTFSLRLADPFFYYYTTLPFDNTGSQIYFFSNSAGTKGAAYPTLSLPISPYQTQRSYRAGDLVIFNNELNEARINMTAAENASYNQENWRKVDKKNYVTVNDKIIHKQGFFDYAFTQSEISHAQFIIKDFREKTILRKEIELKDGNTFTGYKVVLPTLQDGRYSLTVQGNNGYQDRIDFYFEKEISPANTFGIIEIIHQDNNGLGDYKLIDADKNNELVHPVAPVESKAPVYQLLFKNRSTIWRYIFSKDQEIEDENLGEFERDGGANEKRKFITKEAKPLTLYPFALQKFDQDQLLPGASVDNLKPEKDKIFSEIYL